MQSLSNVKAGEACTIKWMLGNIQVMEFLRRHDMKEGSLIRVLQQSSTGTIHRDGPSAFCAGQRCGRTD